MPIKRGREFMLKEENLKIMDNEISKLHSDYEKYDKRFKNMVYVFMILLGIHGGVLGFMLEHVLSSCILGTEISSLAIPVLIGNVICAIPTFGFSAICRMYFKKRKNKSFDRYCSINKMKKDYLKESENLRKKVNSNEQLNNMRVYKNREFSRNDIAYENN